MQRGGTRRTTPSALVPCTRIAITRCQFKLAVISLPPFDTSSEMRFDRASCTELKIGAGEASGTIAIPATGLDWLRGRFRDLTTGSTTLTVRRHGQSSRPFGRRFDMAYQ